MFAVNRFLNLAFPREVSHLHVVAKIQFIQAATQRTRFRKARKITPIVLIFQNRSGYSRIAAKWEVEKEEY